jgi:hypothetical protein
MHLRPRNQLPRAHPPPAPKRKINRPLHLDSLIVRTLEEALRSKHLDVLSKDGRGAHQTDEIVPDCGAGWEVDVVDGVAWGRDGFEMAVEGGRAEADGFVEDGLGWSAR